MDSPTIIISKGNFNFLGCVVGLMLGEKVVNGTSKLQSTEF